MPKMFKKIYLEISNICNLQCTFCPSVERKQAALDANNLSMLLDKIKPFAERVCFHVMGEPLFHPQFSEFVEIAEDLGIDLEITTNGTHLQKANSQALLRNTVKQVNFSLQSFVDNYPKANPSTYLNKILDFCDQAILARPDLYINFRFWNLQTEKASETNEYLLNTLQNKFGVQINSNVDVGFCKSKKLYQRLYVHFDSRFAWPDPRNPRTKTVGTCYGTRSHLAVLVDGQVVPCCFDKEAQIVLGNLSTQTLEEILASPRLKKMQEGFINGRLVEDLCQRCTFIDRFNKSVTPTVEREGSAVPRVTSPSKPFLREVDHP